MSHEALLFVKNVVKTFGGFRALDGIGFELGEGEILGLVGPNGSGKTTCINVISGLYAPTSGEVWLDGKPVGGKPMHKMASLGVNRTFQIPKPFKGLTVRQNLDIARKSSKAAAGQPGRVVVEDPLEFVGLTDVADHEAGSLPSGKQKLLDLARALATSPKLLLVDELAAGLNPSELEQVAEKLRDLSKRGVALVVVEHLLGFVDQLTQRVMVMNAGKEIFEGDLASAANDPTVVAVYLGG